MKSTSRVTLFWALLSVILISSRYVALGKALERHALARHQLVPHFRIEVLRQRLVVQRLRRRPVEHLLAGGFLLEEDVVDRDVRLLRVGAELGAVDLEHQLQFFGLLEIQIGGRRDLAVPEHVGPLLHRLRRNRRGERLDLVGDQHRAGLQLVGMVVRNDHFLLEKRDLDRRVGRGAAARPLTQRDVDVVGARRHRERAGQAHRQPGAGRAQFREVDVLERVGRRLLARRGRGQPGRALGRDAQVGRHRRRHLAGFEADRERARRSGPAGPSGSPDATSARWSRARPGTACPWRPSTPDPWR